MSQSYEIEWVSPPKEFPSQHGPKKQYHVALKGYNDARTVRLNQNADTPPPQVGQSLYGGVHVKTFTNNATGEPFQVHQFTKEQRPDNEGPRQSAPATNGKDDEFWAAKDRRIARAGMMQAVVSSYSASSFPASLSDYVAGVNKLVDALLASLDERVPSPNGDVPAQQVENVAELSGLGYEEPTGDSFDDDSIPF